MEEQLLQSRAALQQLEAELQALHKSCLLQLARSSWVGRVLRSSTGSVEVSLCQRLCCSPMSPSHPSLDFPDSQHAWDREDGAPGTAHLALSRCVPQVRVRSKGRGALPPAPARWPPAPSCRW